MAEEVQELDLSNVRSLESYFMLLTALASCWRAPTGVAQIVLSAVSRCRATRDPPSTFILPHYHSPML